MKNITLSQIYDEIIDRNLNESKSLLDRGIYKRFVRLHKSHPLLKEQVNFYNFVLNGEYLGEAVTFDLIKNKSKVFSKFDKKDYRDLKKLLENFYTKNKMKSTLRTEKSNSVDRLIESSISGDQETYYKECNNILDFLKKNEETRDELEENQTFELDDYKREELKENYEKLDKDRKKFIDLLLLEDEDMIKKFFDERRKQNIKILNDKLKYEDLDSDIRKKYIEAEKSLNNVRYNKNTLVEDIEDLIQLKEQILS